MTEVPALKSILAIDDDASIRSQLKYCLADLGVEHLEFAVDGAQAWEKIQARAYDVIILDWNIPEVSGLALFNRIKHSSAVIEQPVLAISGFLAAKDFRILEEFPCTGICEKPLQKMLLVRKVRDLFQQSTWYQTEKARIDSLGKEALTSIDARDQLIAELKKSPRPNPFLVVLARKLAAAGLFAEAEALLLDIIAEAPEFVAAINERAKIMHQTGRSREAAELLTRAMEISPENLDRLFMLGDMSMKELDTDKARSYFMKSLNIDRDDKRAQAGMHLAESIDFFLTNSSVPRLPDTFASLLNTVGIYYVRTGKMDQGVEHYKHASKYLAAPDDIGKINFNLGLAFLRWNRPMEAIPWLTEAKGQAPVLTEKVDRYSKMALRMAKVENEAWTMFEDADEIIANADELKFKKSS